MRVGLRVRHRTRGFEGEIVAIVSQPLLSLIDRRVVVRVAGRGLHFGRDHHCWASDLEPLASLPPAMIETGLVEDGSIVVPVHVLGEPQPRSLVIPPPSPPSLPGRQVRPGLRVIDGGFSR